MSSRPGWLGHPAVAYVLPFAVFMLLLEAARYVALPQRAELILRLAIPSVVLWVFSRGVLSFEVTRPAGTLAIGTLVFLIWIAPETLFAGYRDHWLFQNPFTGKLGSSLDSAAQQDPVALSLRALRAVVLVPIIEELFWRGWLMRYLIRPNFLSVPLGTYAHFAFCTLALFFCAEHGPYWDVGIVAGAIYNYWICRTRSLGDAIWAHAVTNALLCVYVLSTGKWEYWY